MAIWVFNEVEPAEIDRAAARLRCMGAGTVLSRMTDAGMVLQVVSDRDDVDQLVRQVLPSAVLTDSGREPT
jgi:hypothetical protein